MRLKKIFGDKDHLVRRYILFLAGLFISSLGVAFITKAGLGTSAVTSIPYTFSLLFRGLSFGNWLIIYCMTQIIIEIIILRRRTVISEIVIQIILAFLYGYMIDFSLLILRWIDPEQYFMKLIVLLAGCFILAFGIYLELLGDVGMLSADAFIKVIATVMNKPYGNVKIIVDIFMSVFSALLSLIILHKLVGVREGTIITAFLIGWIIKFYQKCFRKVANRILPGNP